MEGIIALALQAGLPTVTAILQRRMGDSDGKLIGLLLDRVATRLGVPADGIEAIADKSPGKVIDALKEAEKQAADLVQLYVVEAQNAAALAAAESTEPLWMRAWRPAGMYMIGFLWIWNVVLLHVANAIWRIALPPVPFDNLIQLSGLYMGLYMGGHTVKDIASKWLGTEK